MVTATIQVPNEIVIEYGNSLTYENLKKYIKRENSQKLEKWKKLDNTIRNLKVVNQSSANELEKSLNILNKEVEKTGIKNFISAKDEYLTKKYN